MTARSAMVRPPPLALIVENHDDTRVCAVVSDKRTRAIPGVVVTAWAIGEHVERARVAGCVSVLMKPCLPNTLLAETQRILKRNQETLT